MNRGLFRITQSVLLALFNHKLTLSTASFFCALDFLVFHLPFGLPTLTFSILRTHVMTLFIFIIYSNPFFLTKPRTIPSVKVEKLR